LPRKLGQHFLLHEPVLKRLAEAACGEHTHRIIEIGPGRGAFTKNLLPLADEVHVVEVDESLVRILQQKFAGEQKLSIHHADVLKTDLSEWGPAVITGNLPYYITSPILEKFLKLDARFPIAVFLVQLEVANRLMAPRMTRDFGYLTVATQLVCSVELICRVDPKAFNPPPRVDSAAIRLTRRNDIPADLDDILRFASRCLTHKRKTLRNNLRPYYGAEADRQPEGFMRAEQLGVPGLVALYRRLTALSEVTRCKDQPPV
jgi:16S rRNA (adenine1518-N6/adenine1519-N6)-dimethyltransferase